jgi:NAD(P)-dependent dehydrogenase (short-subunit alcohol dehydrogenase family)
LGIDKALVGGGRGIGLALTRAFAEAGATVVITYTSKDPSSVAADVSKEFSVPVHVYHCPGEKSDVVDSMVEKIAKDVGEVDVVVANAGEYPPRCFYVLKR